MPEQFLAGELWEMDEEELAWMLRGLPRIAGKTGGKLLLHRVSKTHYLLNSDAATTAQSCDFAEISSTWHFPTEVCAVDLKRCVVQLYRDCDTSPFVRAAEPSLEDRIRDEVTRQLDERLIKIPMEQRNDYTWIAA